MQKAGANRFRPFFGQLTIKSFPYATLCTFSEKTVLPTSLLTMMGRQTESRLEMPAVFPDNMVLQQNTNITLWGHATPGTKVSLKGEWGVSSSSTTKKDSTWKLDVSTPEAGLPAPSFSTEDELN
ncbi:MAG: hypothetical protein ACOCTO_01485 [Marinilabiliaceae bacterium]